MSLIFLAFLLMFGIFPYVAIKLNNSYFLPVYDFIYFKIIGLVLATIGLTIVIHCAHTLFFKPEQSIPFPIQAPEKFVVEGLYKFIRNPMYLGDFMIILSEFFIFGHLLILIYLAIIIPFVNFMVIFKEEKQLEKRFGKEYAEYKEKVSRWIPHLKIKNL